MQAETWKAIFVDSTIWGPWKVLSKTFIEVRFPDYASYVDQGAQYIIAILLQNFGRKTTPTWKQDELPESLGVPPVSGRLAAFPRRSGAFMRPTTRVVSAESEEHEGIRGLRPPNHNSLPQLIASWSDMSFHQIENMKVHKKRAPRQHVDKNGLKSKFLVFLHVFA